MIEKPNKPAVHASPLPPKSPRDLIGLGQGMVVVGDINEPVLHLLLDCDTLCQ